MPNEQLIAHIRTEFARGIDRAVVIRSLLTAGWKVEDINASIAVVIFFSTIFHQNWLYENNIFTYVWCARADYRFR